MKKSDIETIILQDAEIKRLKDRGEKLERSYLETIRDNIKLRQKIKELEHQNCELNKVNT
jgi:FtsZ-binding cell division protein ZapB